MKPTDPGDLRRRAEEQLRRCKSKVTGKLSEHEAQRLVHELEVHQIELEIQNEELRAARLEMEASLERYSELFDFAPIGYVTLDAEGRILDINHAGARLLGREKSKLIGAHFVRLVAIRDGREFDALLQDVRNGETDDSCEIELMAKPGVQLHARVTATLLARSQPVVMLAFEDITEQKAREERLASTEQALRDLDRRKDDFLAVLSHELRNPLAPIRNGLYILERAAPGSEQSKKAHAIIDRQVTHMTRLIEDLLDVTRITRGKIELHCERLELGDLVRRTMDDQRAGFESSGIALESRFDPGLFWVNADSTRIVQALSNLLGNAEKFTPRGGSVIVKLQREGALVLLGVRDNGAGIAPELLAHLFEPFAQAPQTMDRNRGGLGLGLVMVKGLIELHGGTVRIASDGPGCGTELIVSLPLDTAPAWKLPATALPAALSRRVLLVEDSLDSAESLMSVLECMGHDVRVAHDGVAALVLARDFRPEIVICDLGLPEMDGYDVARAFRADEGLRSAHLIALSGYARPEDLERASEAGFDEHVAKPASPDALARLIAKAPVGGSDEARSDLLH
jgi:two-component system CheB/CheR fusion protein